jgi:hypothetical protein
MIVDTEKDTGINSNLGDLDSFFENLKNLEKNNQLNSSTAISLIIMFYIKCQNEEVEMRKNKFKVKIKKIYKNFSTIFLNFFK